MIIIITGIIIIIIICYAQCSQVEHWYIKNIIIYRLLCKPNLLPSLLTHLNLSHTVFSPNSLIIYPICFHCASLTVTCKWRRPFWAWHAFNGLEISIAIYRASQYRIYSRYLRYHE